MWDVICLAALSAMEMGRRYLAAQLKRPPVARAANVELVERAILRAVSDFWARLFGFALLGLPQVGWDGVGPLHPILRVVDGQLVCVGPAPSPEGPESSA